MSVAARTTVSTLTVEFSDRKTSSLLQAGKQDAHRAALPSTFCAVKQNYTQPEEEHQLVPDLTQRPNRAGTRKAHIVNRAGPFFHTTAFVK